ncbi:MULTISPECIES: hypothetical protein [unclassified Paenibacillus]|uniref:hypothetical protein n=1 Tax=unclassified Paenibacillus TaxID=185978 RepID=UPI0024067F0A|nr:MULTISPECIES: hypothetical protein [unclassified Paenibacillus]MDF9840239.1 glucan phosphoethanolaminetransferase (alkaline phosphatase superfamily) [Paenibacillus sp. PastF-2]MDF9846821.1 glucan phosphoethanolaminetransferase (alkaline phosphatase superfamily) [Paenibacillus sp. PastM-2]MDF9853393.1 hypothetical protein [Paenibacillus sp. PastF-1]MDH6479120.1 hypothetical protein [Paenibacillus sp. PastH-2]MDH6506851.1 glucan phosphoethanolaminetransferase (alkaline phosphatase superfamily
MEQVLFGIVLMVEVALAVYCLVTKQRHRKVKSLVRVAVFIVFVMLTLLPGIEWSFSWIFCASMLLLLAVTGMLQLIRQPKANPRVFKRSAIVAKAILMLIVLTLAFAPVLLLKLRTDDMNLVIDSVVENATKGNGPAVYQLIDPAKIGVFGHSMGGAACVWLGRERDGIGAVLNLDAPLFSELRYDPETGDFTAANEAYNIPLLNIYSDDVWKQLGQNSAYAANQTAGANFR